jgi:predicted short-subunit dehydrogenase-like oxidoreductase (DUF2520 family)
MKIGIIGAGKVGISLGYVLRSNGVDVVGISDITPQALAKAREFLGADTLYTRDNVEIVDTCDIIAIAVQDRLIGDAARSVADRAGDVRGKLFFHTSGADPSSVLSPLEARGASVGSLHPLQTFPDIESAIDVLPDTSIFIEGDNRARDALRFIGENLGAKVYVVSGEDKVYYHLAAVFVCNLVSALMQAGTGVMKRIDIDFEPFIPIIRATMKNIETKGPAGALTGPIVRGDDKTVAAHLEAMADMPLHKEIYLALSKMAFRMAQERGTLDSGQADALRKILGISLDD